jgi:quinol monooxygenase YgiN
VEEEEGGAMILITGTVVVPEENWASFVAAATRHVTLSRTEPGCISHGVHEDVMAPGTFVFVERWRDMAAVKEHFAKDYSREIVAVLGKLSTSSTGVEIHDIASTRVV